jgi:hypothetical protein
MNRSPPPILVCYDASPGAARAVDAAAALLPGRPAMPSPRACKSRLSQAPQLRS